MNADHRTLTVAELRNSRLRTAGCGENRRLWVTFGMAVFGAFADRQVIDEPADSYLLLATQKSPDRNVPGVAIRHYATSAKWGAAFEIG
ncbi:hypothetical protein [Sphingomonas aquatica]|uniref:hypothetical protein n=1 Tax=Sphingomonas aquatica TaxID=1763824 RepID=UPI001454C881